MEQKAGKGGHKRCFISSFVDFIITRIIGFATLKTAKRITKLGVEGPAWTDKFSNNGLEN